MALQTIPLDDSPNQTWNIGVNINGGVSTFFVVLRFNEIANYWVMSIFDVNQNLLLDSLPLLTGLNLLRQFGYLNIGSLFVLNVSNVPSPNYPNSTDLGSDFHLVWGDNVITAAQI